MKKIITAFFIFFTSLTWNEAPVYAQSVTSVMTPLNRACLPLRGRMIRSTTASCHCPPQSFCPVTYTEFFQGKKLPPNIAQICCDPPDICMFETRTTSACGTDAFLNVAELNFCVKWVASSKRQDTDYFKKLQDLVKLSNAVLYQKYGEVLRLADYNTKSETDYAQANLLINQIDVENRRINALIKKYNDLIGKLNPDFAKSEDLKADDLVTIKCAPQESGGNGEAFLCTRNTPEFCPPPPDPCANASGTTFRIARMTGRTTSGLTLEDVSKIESCPTIQWYDCVAEDTFITLADGTQKLVQNIRIGDKLKSYNGFNTVIGLQSEAYKENGLYSINNGALIVTSGHPIMTNEGWRAIDINQVTLNDVKLDKIGKLKIGDEVFTTTEGNIKITSIEFYVGKPIPTYNISTDGDSTFIANGMVIRAYKNTPKF